MRKNRVFTLVKCVFSIGLMAFIVLRVDLNSAIKSLRGVDVSLVFSGLFFMAFGVVIRSYKWRALLKSRGIEIPFLTVLNYNYMSEFFNNMFLGSIGGDAFRVYRAAKYSDSMVGIASSVIFDRMSGLLMSLFTSIFFGTWFFISYGHSMTYNTLIVLALYISFTTFFILFYCIFIPKLNQMERLKGYSFLSSYLHKMDLDIMSYRENYRAIFVSMIFSVLYCLSQSVKMYFFALSAHSGVSILPFFFIVPLVGIIRMIPISINGIGIQEGSLVFFLENIGLSESSAFLVAIMTRIATIMFSLLGGLLFLIYEMRRNQYPLWIGTNGSLFIMLCLMIQIAQH